MWELPRDEIHLWHGFQETDPHPGLRETYGALLSALESEREARFHFERDRFRFRVTRAMARRVLAGYLGIDPGACEFSLNEHGKPSLASGCEGTPLTFNLSHTRDLIVLAVTRGRDLGVDVESMEGQRPTLDLARRFFAPSESDEVAKAPEHARNDLFFQYWTLKESYIKARGLGLAIPLDKFGFRLDSSGVTLWTDPELGDDASRWRFSQWQPTATHRAALCVERDDGPPPRLVMRDFADVARTSPDVHA